MVTSLRLALDHLKSSLVVRISELNAQLSLLQQELDEVLAAEAALPPRSSASSGSGYASSQASRNYWAHNVAESPFASMTIKQLVRKALTERFPEGARAAELLHLFRGEWGRRDMQRSSLSPQLSRLKDEKALIVQNSVWRLPPSGEPTLLGEEASKENEPPADRSASGSDTALDAQQRRAPE